MTPQRAEPRWLVVYGAGAALLPVLLVSWSAERFLALWCPSHRPSIIGLGLVMTTVKVLSSLVSRGAQRTRIAGVRR
jgi:hypothetical protein